MSSLDDLSFSMENERPHQRNAYRALVRGLEVKVDDDDQCLNICDISSAGCCIQSPPVPYEVGRILRLHLEARGKTIVRNVNAKVVRLLEDGNVACFFQSLTRQQEMVLDKLVLEIQKSLISKKKF